MRLKASKEIVETVKFQFLNKSFINQTQISKQNILTTNELPKYQNIYGDVDGILKDLLKGKQYKHSKHIQFLVKIQEQNLMKLRFVLQPFAFMIVGEKKYHIVLETLNTEEATYIWHLEKSKSLLIDTIKQIDTELNIIRENGR